MSRHSIKILSVSFLVGVSLGAKFYLNLSIYFLILIFVLFVTLFLKFKEVKVGYLLGVIMITVLFGALRYQFSLPNITSDSIHYYRSEERVNTMRGIITENPDRRREKVNYIVDMSEIQVDGKTREVTGRVLVSSDLYPAYNYGDLVEIRGFLIEPIEFETFSYKNYLSLHGVYSVMYRPRIKKISDGYGNSLFAILFSMKDIFEAQLNKLYPEPMASFEAGLLTGSRKGIPEDLMLDFNLTGLTHIIAISGYNISLIIVLISSFFKRFSRRVKIPVIIIFIILFTLFVGASAAVVRASIMGIIAVLALWFGRQSQIINALLISAFIMTLWKPQTLLYDVGFQLSFLATLGLIITGNRILEFFSFIPEAFGLRESFAMTFSAQVFALPVILFNFKRLSIISPIANVAIVAFIPIAMLFGFISVILSFISFSLGFLVSFPAWLVLKISVVITHFLANIPFASVEIEWFSIWHLFFYYMLFVVFSYFIYPNFRNIFFGEGRFNIRFFPISNRE